MWPLRHVVSACKRIDLRENTPEEADTPFRRPWRLRYRLIILTVHIHTHTGPPAYQWNPGRLAISFISTNTLFSKHILKEKERLYRLPCKNASLIDRCGNGNQRSAERSTLFIWRDAPLCYCNWGVWEPELLQSHSHPPAAGERTRCLKVRLWFPCAHEHTAEWAGMPAAHVCGSRWPCVTEIWGSLWPGNVIHVLALSVVFLDLADI